MIQRTEEMLIDIGKRIILLTDKLEELIAQKKAVVEQITDDTETTNLMSMIDFKSLNDKIALYKDRINKLRQYRKLLIKEA